MDVKSKKVVLDLVLGITELIRQSKVTDQTRQQAEAILDYYVINPVITRDPDFFTGTDVRSKTELSAPAQWTPFLIHVLKTGYAFFKAELERLPEACTLDIQQGVPTPQELIDRFVTALAGFYEADHTNYHEMRCKLIEGILKGTTHDETIQSDTGAIA